MVQEGRRLTLSVEPHELESIKAAVKAFEAAASVCEINGHPIRASYFRQHQALIERLIDRYERTQQ